MFMKVDLQTLAVVMTMMIAIVAGQKCGNDECATGGLCYKDNQTWEKDCFTFRCNAGNSTWSTQIVDIKCKNKDNTCVTRGESMPDYGSTCVCEIQGNGWRTKC